MSMDIRKLVERKAPFVAKFYVRIPQKARTVDQYFVINFDSQANFYSGHKQ